MKATTTVHTIEDRDRLAAEIGALERWCKDLMHFIDNGLRDPGVTREEFSDAATMATRLVVRLKTLYDRAGDGAASPGTI